MKYPPRHAMRWCGRMRGVSGSLSLRGVRRTTRSARGDSLRRRGVAQRRTVCGCRRACRKPALDSAGRFRTRHGTLLADGIPAGAGTGERRIRQPSDPRGGTAGAYGRASRARADRPPCAFRAERVLPDVFLSGYGGRTARHGRSCPGLRRAGGARFSPTSMSQASTRPRV